MRQAPECLVPGHISVRLRELVHVFFTYNTVGRREAIVLTCPPLVDWFMIKVSTQYTVNLVGILVAYLD